MAEEFVDNLAMTIGLIGDYSENVTAHRAIPIAIELASRELSGNVEFEWIDSGEITMGELKQLTGIWCVPASPYANMEKVLLAIRFARENDVPFLGTCGGYQHAALEFARNALGYADAENGEVDPDAGMPLISGLACKLVEVSDRIILRPESKIAGIYGEHSISEEYRCGFGVNRQYLSIYDGSEMTFTGFDADGDPRALEIPSHRFFIGTAFQPERSGLKNLPHPLVTAFVDAATNEKRKSRR